MGRLACLFVIFLVTATRIHGLSCRNCVKVSCKDPENCKYGFVKEVCGCCNVCGKGPGEQCGGTWGLLGKCGAGYTCEIKKNEGDYIRSPFPEGVCVIDQAIPVTLSPAMNLVNRPAGGGSASGLLGGYRAGQAKKLAKQHKHQDFGSAIPPEFAALLRQKNQGRGKRDLFDSMGEYLGSQQGQRLRRALGGSRRAGGAKLTATKHIHQVSGGIPLEFAALLKQYNRQG